MIAVRNLGQTPPAGLANAPEAVGAPAEDFLSFILGLQGQSQPATMESDVPAELLSGPQADAQAEVESPLQSLLNRQKGMPQWNPLAVQAQPNPVTPQPVKGEENPATLRLESQIS